MPEALEKLPVARPRVRASRRLEFRSGDAQVRAAHELFDDGAVDTAVSHITDQRCYVCRKPMPTNRELRQLVFSLLAELWRLTQNPKSMPAIS